jgi:hypothetical protein
MQLLYEKNNSIKNSVLLIFRYWAAFRQKGDNACLNKAYFICAQALEKNFADIRLAFIRVFLELEFGRTDSADDTLQTLEQYKNHLKQNEPENYLIYLFLTALLDIKNGKDKRALKTIRQMNEAENKPNIVNLLLAYLHIYRADYQNAYNYLATASKIYRGSFFVLMGFHMVFAEKAHVRDDNFLFTDFLRWGISSGVSYDSCVDFYQSSIITKNSKDLEVLKKIYGTYPKRWLLELICQNLTAKFDYSSEAYRYYKDAETKQLIMNNLETHLVRAAFVNKNEDIAHFTMANFLKRYNDDHNLKSFVFHLLTSNAKYADLCADNKPEIMEFAVSSLRDNERGRYYNSIYAYYLSHKPEDADENLLKLCNNILYENLFGYEAVISNSEIKYVWVFDKEKKDHSVFEAVHNPPYRPRVKIKSVSKNLSVTCFDESRKKIINETIEFKKSVEPVSLELFTHFHNLYPQDTDILIVLAKYYTQAAEIPESGIDTLNKVLSLKNISRNFRMQVTASLGNLLASQSRYDKAIEYYNVVDENYLSDYYIEQMLTAFINAKDYEKAVRLIIKKSHCVSDRTLFFALKQIAMFEKYHQSVADVAYELILKSWYDKNLINIVIEHYKGSQEDYQQLGIALNSIQAPEITLDKKILENCIGMHKLDTKSQRVFSRMYSSMPDAKILDIFIYYLCYEMIIQNTKIEAETVSILESHFSNTKDSLLSYALMHLYLNHNITTAVSGAVINYATASMEEDGIIFECAALIKDKDKLSPYIIKNTPFVYRTLPNKSVFLNYRVDNTAYGSLTGAKYRDGETHRVKMKYYKFGLYMCAIPHFYNEKLIYYFSEESKTGSITTAEREVTNSRAAISENTDDMYFTVNNALVYEQMFRYNEVESVISSQLKATRRVKAKII